MRNKSRFVLLSTLVLIFAIVLVSLYLINTSKTNKEDITNAKEKVKTFIKSNNLGDYNVICSYGLSHSILDSEADKRYVEYIEVDSKASLNSSSILDIQEYRSSIYVTGDNECESGSILKENYLVPKNKKVYTITYTIQK